MNPTDHERGVALVVVMLAILLLTAVGVALVLVTSVELQIAKSFRDGQQALQAAEAGLERAAQELDGTPQWDDVLSGAIRSRIADTTTSPTLPGGGATVDLGVVTAELGQDPERRRAWGTAPPIWRLYAWGPAPSLHPQHAADSHLYVAVWVADDAGDGDGNGQTDANGALILHAEAYGFGGTRRIVEAVVGRPPDTLEGVESLGIRLLAWEEIR